MRAEMRKLTALPTHSRLSPSSTFDGALEDVAARLSKIETVILNDPAKSLEMPLLGNELEHTKKGYQSDLVALKEEVGRIYDLTKWFIGLMFTMALGVIGLAVTNFFQDRVIEERLTANAPASRTERYSFVDSPASLHA